LIKIIGANDLLVKASLMTLVTQCGHNLLKKEFNGSNVIGNNEKFMLNTTIKVRGHIYINADI